MTNGYNGWTNYETWNAVLWIDNDCGTYKARIAAEPRTAEECRAFASECFGTTVTPDGAELSRVNWAEVASRWADEY